MQANGGMGGNAFGWRRNINIVEVKRRSRNSHSSRDHYSWGWWCCAGFQRHTEDTGGENTGENTGGAGVDVWRRQPEQRKPSGCSAASTQTHNQRRPSVHFCESLGHACTHTHHTHTGLVQRVLWMAWSTNVTALCVQVTHGGHIAANVSCGGLCWCKLVLSSPADSLLPCLAVLNVPCLNVLRPLHQLHVSLMRSFMHFSSLKDHL